MTMGIYAVTNITNGKRYVGSAVNINRRWNGHKRGLRKGKHENRYLQKSWNKYGEKSFEFNILEIVTDRNDLVMIEQYYLDWLEPEYNIGKIAGSAMLGLHHSEDAKRKISAAHIGRPLSQEHRTKLSIAHMGQLPPNTGKSHSAEARAKMSLAHKGKPSPKKGKPSPTKGRPFSIEHRAHLSEAGKASWAKQKEEGTVVPRKIKSLPCFCGESHYAKGLCKNHYRKAHGWFKRHTHKENED